jgi:hypothetical protein
MDCNSTTGSSTAVQLDEGAKRHEPYRAHEKRAPLEPIEPAQKNVNARIVTKDLPTSTIVIQRIRVFIWNMSVDSKSHIFLFQSYLGYHSVLTYSYCKI